MEYSHILLMLFFAISVPVHDFRSIEQESSAAGNETAFTVEPTSPVSESLAQINESNQPRKEIDDKNADLEKDGTTVDNLAQQPSDGDGVGKVGSQRGKELIKNGTNIIDQSSLSTDGIKLEPRSLLTEFQKDRSTPDNGNGTIPNTENTNLLLDEVDKKVQSDLPTLILDSKNTTNEILATDASAVIDNQQSQEIHVRSRPITEKNYTVIENAEQLLANYTDLIVKSSTSTDGNIDEIVKDKSLKNVEASGISLLSSTNETIYEKGKSYFSSKVDASQKSLASNNQPSPEVGLQVEEFPITENKHSKIENRNQLPSNSTDSIEDSSTPTDGNIEEIEKDKSSMTVKASEISGTNNNSNIQLSTDTQVGKLPITEKDKLKFGEQQSSTSKDLIVESLTPPQTDEKIGNYNSSTDLVTSDIPELSYSTNLNTKNGALMSNNSSVILNGSDGNASFPQRGDIKDFRERTVTDPKYSLHIGDQVPRENFQNNSADTIASDISNKEVNNGIGNKVVDGIHNSTKSHPSKKQAQKSHSATIWTPFDWKEYNATKLDQDNSDSINNNEANVEAITPGEINIKNYSMIPIEDYQPNDNINTFNDRNSNLSSANSGIKLFLNLDEVSFQRTSYIPKSQKNKKVHLTEYSEYLFVPGNFIDNQSPQTKLSSSCKEKFERESRRRKNVYYPEENVQTFTNKFENFKSGIFHLKKHAQSNQKHDWISKPSDLNRVANFRNSIKSSHNSDNFVNKKDPTKPLVKRRNLIRLTLQLSSIIEKITFEIKYFYKKIQTSNELGYEETI
ncbi:bromodomain-containing protein DDB_G0270170 [Nilaparvata lugens]|uniref:Seminal fluid protein n=1 Tax=Nilaparvata lugens TaxID=108931 RepID=A0A1I9WLA8_NILLU|nr:bromodomain-containing protein DDB_G0270170 [Nilaparvata lugens]APA33928.1 seminal fluid protein [Nilaparvata lugens]